MLYRESDMLIVVMKPGNAGGAKGHALMCRGLRKHSPVAELGKSGDTMRPPIKKCGRVLLVSNSEEPYAGKPHVRFCEGGSIP